MSKLSKALGSFTGKSAYKKEMRGLNEQISAYQREKDRLHSENEKLSTEKNTEMQKIHEKQIRALRKQYRAPGFLEQPTMGDSSATMG